MYNVHRRRPLAALKVIVTQRTLTAPPTTDSGKPRNVNDNCCLCGQPDEYTRMLFEDYNAPATFHRVIQTASQADMFNISSCQVSAL